MKIQGGLIDIALTQGKEIRLRGIAAHFEAQATGLEARGGGVFEHDGEEFVDFLRIDFEDDDDVDHKARERRFSMNMQPRTTYPKPILRPT